MSRRLGAWGLTLALIAVIAAAVIPTCADSLCCIPGGEARVKAQMACCEPSISSGDVRQQPMTFTAQAFLPQTDAPAATTFEPPVLRADSPPGISAAHHQPSPPLFLRNAQFLI